MPPIILRLPESLSTRSFEDVALMVDPPQGGLQSAIFDYTHVRFAALDAHVHMLGLCNRMLRAGATVELWWPAGAPREYAQAMGFFQVLDPRIKVRPARPGPRDSSGMSVPLVSLVPDDRAGIEAAVRDVHDTVRYQCLGLWPQAPDIAGHVWTVAAELVQNIVDWSGTPVPGMIGVQGYRDRISICIADSGVGIARSIRRHQPRVAGHTDREIILQAFQDGLSSRSEPGGGAGLTQCAKIAAKYEGRLSVRTSRAWAKLIVRAKRTGLAGELFEGSRAHIDGTIICLDLVTAGLMAHARKQGGLDRSGPPA